MSYGRQALKAGLSSPRLPVYLALTAIALTLPALGIGWQLDDHFQRLVMLGRAQDDLSPMAAFSVLDGEPGLTKAFRDLGYLPWWTPEDFRLAFFRPLALATTRLDYRLWPDAPALMHAHSLLWFAALAAGATLLYRRLLGPAWVAGLAALLYAVDDVHALPAAWLANRNAMLAAVFGVLCLLAHDRWRRDGWRPGAVLAPSCLGLALLSGEIGLATTGYLFAHAVFLDSGSDTGLDVRPKTGRRKRWPGPLCWRALWPHALVTAAWFVAYSSGGYGAKGSGLYLDPLRRPAAYAEALLERVPFFVMGQWTPLPADLGSLLPPRATWAWWLAASAITLVVSAIFLPALRRDRVARFWALGMALSLLPISATFPSNRLLVFVSLGAMGLLARFLAVTLGPDRAAGGPPRRFARALAWSFAVTHLVLAPISLFAGPIVVRQLGEPMRTAAASLGDDPRLARQLLVVANAPDYLMFVTNLPTLQALEYRPLPRALLALSAGPTPLELDRIDARTLRVRLERGLFAGSLGRLFRAAEDPLAPGAVVRAAGIEIEIFSVAADGSPNAIIYRFPTRLEDPGLRWVRWHEGRYLDFEPPAVGDTVSLPAAVGPFDRFGWSR